MIRETKFLINMGFNNIPLSAKVVLLLSNQLKIRFSKVKHVYNMYNHMIRSTNPIIRNVLKPHVLMVMYVFCEIRSSQNLIKFGKNSKKISQMLTNSRKIVEKFYKI